MFDNPKQKFGSFFLTDINELFITHSLHTFAFSLAGLFIPIFLLENGFSFMQVMFYLLLQASLSIPIFYGFLKLSAKIGVKLGIGLGLLLMIIDFLLLKEINYLLFLSQNLIILLLATIHVIAATSYWSAFHLGLSIKADSKKAGSQTSTFRSLSTASSIIAPFFGGLVIAAYSYNTLFSITLLIIVLALFPLFLIREMYDGAKIKIKDFFTISSIREGIPYFAEGYHHFLTAKLWPVFLFIVAINVKEIGFFYTISNLLLVIFTIYAGRLHDTFHYYRVMKFGAALHSLTLAIRVFFRNVYALGITQGFGGLSFALLSTNFTADYIQSSKERGVVRTVYEREFFLNLGRIFLIAIVALVYSYTHDILISLSLVFILGAFSPMIMLQVEKNKKRVEN